MHPFFFFFFWHRDLCDMLGERVKNRISTALYCRHHDDVSKVRMKTCWVLPSSLIFVESSADRGWWPITVWINFNKLLYLQYNRVVNNTSSCSAQRYALFAGSRSATCHISCTPNPPSQMQQMPGLQAHDSGNLPFYSKR